jgi:hypothetical protein
LPTFESGAALAAAVNTAVNTAVQILDARWDMPCSSPSGLLYGTGSTRVRGTDFGNAMAGISL